MHFLNTVHALNSKSEGAACATISQGWVPRRVQCSPGANQAKIVHVQRDPRATCWSIYKHLFQNESFHFAYHQEKVVEYYKLYSVLMMHWNQRYPNKILNLQYEELIHNQEKVTRSLLTYVGLNWEPKCLEFYKNKSYVQTASNQQVRQKLYRGSSEKWKNFEAGLRQMLAKLEELELI